MGYIFPRVSQVFGTDICHEFLLSKIPQMDKLWIRCFEIFYSQNRDANVVVSDVRFAEEVESIRKLGGTIIEIQRPEKDSDVRENGLVRDPMEHASETESKNIIPDYIIQNDSSIKHLAEELSKIIVTQYYFE